VLRATQLAANIEVTVDDESLGLARGAIEGGALGRFVANGQEINFVAQKEFMVRGVTLVRAYSQDHSIGSKLSLKLGQRRHLFNAGCTPGCPEIQDNDFTLEVMQRNSLIRVFYGEVLGRATHQTRVG